MPLGAKSILLGSITFFSREMCKHCLCLVHSSIFLFTVEYVSGCSYAVGACEKCCTHRHYLSVPSSVDITGPERIASLYNPVIPNLTLPIFAYTQGATVFSVITLLVMSLLYQALNMEHSFLPVPSVSTQAIITEEYDVTI